jgi:HAD superfamily hydrolase (TIGR01509 family)
MDGVLVDSEPLHLRATQAALGDRGPSFTTRDNQAFFGVTDVEMLRVLRILFNLPASTAELVEAKRRHLVVLIQAGVPSLPGVPDVVHRLRASGLALGLASASPRVVIDTVLQTVGLAGTFQAVVSGDHVQRGKPAPDAFLLAARRLELEPAACLVVEDSRNGVLAAKAAGMTVAAIPCPATSHEDFSAADLVLPSLEALPKALELDTLRFPGVGRGRA